MAASGHVPISVAHFHLISVARIGDIISLRYDGAQGASSTPALAQYDTVNPVYLGNRSDCGHGYMRLSTSDVLGGP